MTAAVVEATVLNTLDDLRGLDVSSRMSNVTGLTEPADTVEADSDHHEKRFVELCQQHLPVSYALPLRGRSRRLGKTTADDPRLRRLLIKLDSEEKVRSVLAAAKTLRYTAMTFTSQRLCIHTC